MFSNKLFNKAFFKTWSKQEPSSELRSFLPVPRGFLFQSNLIISSLFRRRSSTAPSGGQAHSEADEARCP